MAETLPTVASLRHRLTFQSLVRTLDDQGGAVESWVDYATRWGSMKDARGKEYLISQRIEPLYDHVVDVRWDDGIIETMRILFRARIFHIKSVERIDNERRFFMRLKVMENVGT